MREIMREKLIILLKQHNKPLLTYLESNLRELYEQEIDDIGKLADHLIESGVVIPVRCSVCRHMRFKECVGRPVAVCEYTGSVVYYDEYCNRGKRTESEEE